MLIESDPHQTRIAVLEDDRLTEIFVERHRHRGLVGNVYKGRVTRVLPGMQAAFVDVGLERDAFLYVSDVASDVEAMEDLEIDDGRADDLEPSHPQACRPRSTTSEAGAGDHRPGRQGPAPQQGGAHQHPRHPARALPVLLPTVRHFGVSRRIEDEAERERLLAMLQQLPVDGGRADRAHRGRGEGARGVRERPASTSRGSGTRSASAPAKVSAPTLLHQDLDLALRVVRDLLRQDFAVLWVDGEETYERIVEFLDQVQPALVSKVKLFRQQKATLFEQFGIEEQIEAALKSKVWLKSGGYIVINPTEALVAIDVNTGRFVGPDQPRGHGAADQPGGGPGDRAPDPPARPGRDHRHRSDRHGREPPTARRSSPAWRARSRRTGRRPSCSTSPSSAWSRSPASAAAPTWSACSPSAAPTAAAAGASSRSPRSASTCARSCSTCAAGSARLGAPAARPPRDRARPAAGGAGDPRRAGALARGPHPHPERSRAAPRAFRRRGGLTIQTEPFALPGWTGELAAGFRPADLAAALRSLTDPAAALKTLHWGRNYLYVARMETAAGAVEVVVKQFRHRDSPRPAEAPASGSKAAKSWRVATALLAAGLSTPEPVLWIESADEAGRPSTSAATCPA